MSRLLALLIVLPSVLALRMRLGSGPFSRSRALQLEMTQQLSPPQSELQMRDRLSNGDYSGAYNVLKRNPMMNLSMEDARVLLNHLDKLVSTEEAGNTMDEESYQKKLIETSSYLYKRCARQMVIRGFGSVDADGYPLSSMNEVSPQRLEEITGLPMTSLTPKSRGLYWQLAGISVCAAEFLLGNAIGIDPLYTLIPGTMAIFAVDQLFYKGAYFESAYQKLFPEYKEKIIYHEAGHFLLAYLLGVPVRGVVTSAMDARKFNDIRGSAGTIFYDTKLAEELEAQKVTRSSIDRLSIVVMAGIAAEALRFGRAEGGMSDEQALAGFLSSVQPPWSGGRIQGQARWAASQAIQLLREHQASYDALVEVLSQQRGDGEPIVGDAVKAIEAALPSSPAPAVRVKEREGKRRMREVDALMRFVQRRSYTAGGIAPAKTTLLQSASAVVSDQVGVAIASESALSVGATSPGTVMGTATGTTEPTVEAARAADVKIAEFGERMQLLEKAVQRGDLDVSKLAQGGLWLNDLRSLVQSETQPEPQQTQDQDQGKDQGKDQAETEQQSSLVINSRGIAVPTPLPGYEQAVEKLNVELAERSPFEFAAMSVGVSTSGDQNAVGVQEGKGIVGTEAQALGAASPPRPTQLDTEGLLRSNRGYQIKDLENASGDLVARRLQGEKRLKEIKAVLKS